MVYEKPQYSMTFDEGEGQVIKGTEAQLNSLTKKVLQSLAPPAILSNPDTYVKLPSGVVIDNELIHEAEVQELNGYHEERLAKVQAAFNPAKYISTMVECGTVNIGGHPVTPALIADLLQGDIDAIILGIRRATFGSEFEVIGVECPSCNELMDLKMNLKDIPVREMKDSSERSFVVPLRNGRKANVQFPTGAVQAEIFKKEISVPEMNNITLAHCVISFIEADGSERMCNGITDAKSMGTPDRRKVIKFITDNQPGPRYDEVYALCSSCEGEVPVPIDIGILFREF